MGRRRRGRGVALDGVVFLDKSLGRTSNDAVQEVRRIFKAQKVGHTGTLDKLATGVLPLCFGESTKFSRFGLDAKKTYLVKAELGKTTATGDADSEVNLSHVNPDFGEEDVETVLKQFRGEISQVPSMYSALKHEGQPLHKFARRGEEIERESRPVVIYENTLLGLQDNCLQLKVTCSKGTYIRTLVEDIGKALGCGAYVTSLRRTEVGHISISQCVTVEQLYTAKMEDKLEQFLYPPDAMVSIFPIVKFAPPTAYAIRLGQSVDVPDKATKCGWVRLFEVAADGTSHFMGIGEFKNGRVSPRRLISLTYP